MLWTKSNRERVVGFVLRHCCKGDIGRIGEVGFGGAVDVAKELGNLADAIGAVVEEEKGIIL